jgi:hypothetical protein
MCKNVDEIDIWMIKKISVKSKCEKALNEEEKHRRHLIRTNGDESVSPDGADVDFMPGRVEADDLQVL